MICKFENQFFHMLENIALENEALQRNSIIIIGIKGRVTPRARWEVNIKSTHEEQFSKIWYSSVTLSWFGSLSYRNQSIGLQSKSMDWFLYDRDICHERVNDLANILSIHSFHELRYYCYHWYNSRIMLKNWLLLNR